MKKIKVPILTEEYAVWVYIGKPEQVRKETSRYLGKEVEKEWNELHRGRTYQGLNYKKHPLIIINGNLPYPIALATLAHEASHAVDYIAEFVGITDTSGEFKGHGIAAIIRGVGKVLKVGGKLPPPFPKKGKT